MVEARRDSICCRACVVLSFSCSFSEVGEVVLALVLAPVVLAPVVLVVVVLLLLVAAAAAVVVVMEVEVVACTDMGTLHRNRS